MAVSTSVEGGKQEVVRAALNEQQRFLSSTTTNLFGKLQSREDHFSEDTVGKPTDQQKRNFCMLSGGITFSLLQRGKTRAEKSHVF